MKIPTTKYFVKTLQPKTSIQYQLYGTTTPHDLGMTLHCFFQSQACSLLKPAQVVHMDSAVRRNASVPAARVTHQLVNVCVWLAVQENNAPTVSPSFLSSCLFRLSRFCVSHFVLPLTACADDRYGVDCKEQCVCQNSALCDDVSGECLCTAGWFGKDCGKQCPPNRSASSELWTLNYCDINQTTLLRY